MDEPVVKQIMAHYFKVKDVKAVQQKGSGPDFLEEGSAVELKGTKGGFDRAIRQFVNYTLIGKYRALSVAFPYDFLDAGKLARFSLFCEAAWGIGQIVRTYILSEDNSFYYVAKFDDGRHVLPSVLSQIHDEYYKVKSERSNWQREIAKKATEEFEDSERMLLNNLRKLVERKPDLTILKSSLPILVQTARPIGPDGRPIKQRAVLRKGFSSDDRSVMR